MQFAINRRKWIRALAILTSFVSAIIIFFVLQENDNTVKVSAEMIGNKIDSVFDSSLYYSIANSYITEEGQASWYGKKFHNRKTSSGERYDMNLLTAAHKTLPFGSIVKVVNPENNQVVFVRINDRGPFRRSKIIDLSYASAKEISSFNSSHIKIETVNYDNILRILPQGAKCFLAFSNNSPILCLPEFKLNKIDSSGNFDEAYEKYKLQRAEGNYDIFLCSQISKEGKAIVSNQYYICKVKKKSEDYKKNEFANK